MNFYQKVGDKITFLKGAEIILIVARKNMEFADMNLQSRNDGKNSHEIEIMSNPSAFTFDYVK
jgi:hypothetical protein